MLVLNRYGLASSSSLGEPGLYGFGRADCYVSVFQTCLCSPTLPRVGRGSVHHMKRNAVTRSIFHATRSRAVFNRNAAGNACATSATDTPEHSKQQR
ncbi:hypothetical protein [Ralstonia mannitolilytica]|uniref:hypothetical protein n=1 Tax=Ralstonia mannitolilytica TaxID=105219 RepID=UPI00292FADD7|nr:hypothetical protein [Ralstonia mannitolilytica]